MSRLEQFEASPFKVATYFDDRGSLSVLEFGEISFHPKRIFWINNVPVGINRAAHFHRKCNQILICTRGGVKVKVTNSKIEISEFLLENGYGYLLQVNSLIEYSFVSAETQLLVLADQAYDATDVFTIDDWSEASR
jgi:UDP-2-acetamido-3-amino-2,3-dideoxy-glucuronate N-acetyltransferase